MTVSLRIGTRGSPLALVQANQVRDRLLAADPGLAVEIVVIRTSGDRIQDRTLAEAGGKGLFTKEIEEALADRRIDLAVHSMKDVPTWLPEGMGIGCLLPREDPRDALIVRPGLGARGLAGLPEGCVVGTASLRRQAQVLACRPDLRVVPLRGNVGTRLAKLESGVCDATLLALAGLRRLHRDDVATAVLDPAEMLPAVAQGAIGIETRTDDAVLAGRLAVLNDAATTSRVAAERALLAVLDGSCRTPIAALAEIGADGWLTLDGLVARPDGGDLVRVSRRGPVGDAAELGADAGAELKARMPADLRIGP